jgi:hypothetical protein
MALSQNNPTWKDAPLGFDSADPNSQNYGTIGMYGCYVTAIANVCEWAGTELNPLQVNELCCQRGWFVRSDLINNDSIPALLCDNLQFVGKTKWSGPTPMDFFSDASDPNVCYIIEIDASYAPGIQTHFTMVWSTLGSADLEIDDSWDGVRKPLSHYGTPSAIIQSATKFVKNQPALTSPYTISVIEPKQLHVTPNHYKWNLAQPNFDAIVANPITSSGTGLDFTAVATLTRPDLPGYTWYLEDANTPHGWNSLDCTDVTPKPLPSPYVPPAAPIKGTLAERYEVFTNLPVYESAEEVAKAKNPVDIIQPGTYYVWSKKGTVNNYWDLSSSNMVDENKWINTNDNKKPLSVPVPVKSPVPTPSPVVEKPVDTASDWKSTRVWFYPNSNRTKFDLYELQADVIIRDLEGRGKEFMVFAAKPNSSDNAILKVYGTVYKDGVKYYLLHLPEDVDWLDWYAIPVQDKRTGKPYLLKYSDLYSTAVKKPHDYTMAELALEGFARIGFKVFDVVRELPVKIKKLRSKK